MSRQPFSVPEQGNLDSTGGLVLTITVPSGVIWYVVLTSVSTTETDPTVPPPTVNIYRGTAVSPAGFLERTYQGNGAPSDTRHTLLGGDSLTAEWVGGTPGKRATFRLSGMQETV